MKITLVSTLLTILSLTAASSITRRADTIAQPPSFPKAKQDSGGALRVRGGDVVILQGTGGRNTKTNEIIIIDISNNPLAREPSNSPPALDFANVILMQGSNTYTLNDGRVTAQNNPGPQANVGGNSAKTVTATVTSTITSLNGGATGVLGGNVVVGSSGNSTSVLKGVVSRVTGTTLSTSAKIATKATTAAVKMVTTKDTIQPSIATTTTTTTTTETVGGAAKKTAA